MRCVGSTNCCIVLATIAVLSNSIELRQSSKHIAGRDSHHASLIVKEAAIPQQLVICNAYTSEKPLEILHVRRQRSLGGLAYRQCAEFTLPLEDGDQLDFKAGQIDIGTFFATGLPQYTGSLLLVAHRRNSGSSGLAFESHAFADLEHPQIACIDTYHGKNSTDTGVVKISATEPISDSADGGELTQIEDELKFSSVVAVNAGKYNVALSGNNSERMTKVPLNAEGNGKYVVMRVGGDWRKGNKIGYYSQELVVFPSSAISTSLSMIAIIFAVCSVGRFFLTR
mmetsp:Transcript_9125/g.14532  ORF Transcript_9125/g.14532 Transcript_9125/m.14532 type:complete len:283 (+) Transcript_9125:34-882(+)